MTLGDILKGIKFQSAVNAGGVDIKRITNDSRTVGPGDLFVAVKGYASDGNSFIDEAMSRGAKAVIAERGARVPKGVVTATVDNVRSALPVMAANFYGHPSGLLKVIGVTGTNGKTTITYILESIIKNTGKDAGVVGTINYRIKDRVVPAKNTTPGPLELQSLLADMVGSGLDYAVMEVSSHSLDQGRVDNVWFDAAIFTNITGEHLDYHKTMPNYLAAKLRIFDHLKNGGAAVLNNDDTRVASLKGAIRKNCITYGIKNEAQVRAKDIKLSIDGSEFIINTPTISFDVRTGLVGMHNVSNILAAVSAALVVKINVNAIKRGLERCFAVPGRLEPVEAGQTFKVFVDYAHTEDALRNILNLLREVREGRIITVFGCGGNRDATKRPLMGKAACELSDHVIITSDNPRFEEPEDIIRQIELGVKGRFANYDILADRRSAIEKAFGMADGADIVVIAGKGHEDYQIIKDKTIHFDDREVAREILKDYASV